MGHYNMGGYDIFYSTRLDNGQWSKPINAGYPLNTTNDDCFLHRWGTEHMPIMPNIIRMTAMA